MIMINYDNYGLPGTKRVPKVNYGLSGTKRVPKVNYGKNRPKEDETLMLRVHNSNGQYGSYNRPNKEGNCNNVAQNRGN